MDCGIDGQGDRELYTAGPDKRAAASWFPDGKRLVILGDTPTHTRVGIHTLETKLLPLGD